MRGNRGLSNGPVSSYVKSFTEELHTRPYMVIKRTCVWNKTFALGHFMLHFITFIMFLYIREITVKASNVDSQSIELESTTTALQKHLFA